MTHQEFIEKAINFQFEEVIKPLHLPISDTRNIWVVWSCKTANNSKTIIADAYSDIITEATLIGSQNMIVYDSYKKVGHIEKYNIDKS